MGFYRIYVNNEYVGYAKTLKRAHEFVFTYVRNNNKRAALWVKPITCDNAVYGNNYPISRRMDYKIPYYVKDNDDYNAMTLSYTLSHHFWWEKNGLIYNPNFFSHDNFHQVQELSDEKIVFQIV